MFILVFCFYCFMSYHVFMFYYVLCFYYVLYFYYISVCGINPIQKGAAHRLHPFFNHKPYVYFIYNSLPPNHPWGQSLCRKSTSGWTVASVLYGAGRQSIATKIRAATVQSSVWTLQQIFVRQTILFYMYKKSGYIAFASLHNH